MEAVADAAAAAVAVEVWISVFAEPVPVRCAVKALFATGAQETVAERDTALAALGEQQQQMRLKEEAKAQGPQSASPASPRGRLARQEVGLLSNSGLASDSLWNCACW